MTHHGDPQRLCLNQLMGSPKLLFHMNGWSWCMLHNFLAVAGFSDPQPVGTSSSPPRLTGRTHLCISKPSTNSSHLRLLYSSGMVAQSKTQVGTDLGLHHLGNPRATQWTATDHIRTPSPRPSTADPPQRAEVGGKWSQPILAADWLE